MKKIFSIVLYLTSTVNSFSQITFQKTYGGTSGDFGYSVQQTTDGGYILAGRTFSFLPGNGDVYLIKTDSIGDTLWTKTFGETAEDYGYSVQQTTDGGYIVTGETSSFSAGGSNVYLIKTDANGDTLWTKIFGGTGSQNHSYSIQQTADGGYIIAGYTTGFFSGGHGVYLIKTDVNGNLTWSKTFGGPITDFARSVQQTTDGGYIIAGYTNSFGAGNLDVYLIKTDSNGNLLWSKTFGGTGSEVGYSVKQTTDGGYIITGNTESFGAGSSDVYLVKTDVNGDLLWSKTFGGGFYDFGYCVLQTTDGGYIIAGNTWSFTLGLDDIYLIKTDANGDSLWTKTIGATYNEIGNCIQQTSDGGYVVIGSSGSPSNRVYLVKIDTNGNSGCNEESPATSMTTPATQMTNPPTTDSTGGPVTSPPTIVGSGAIVTTLCTTVGISPTPALPGEEGAAIAPNPATNNFIITFPNTIHKGSIEIYTVLGKKIFNENISTISQKEIQIKNVNAGIYFVKVRDGEKEYCEKLIIEN